MTDLTYKTPETPHRPFAVGDVVDVLDRNHAVISQQRVVLASGRIVGTECGRLWKQNGWWMGEDQAWPFPSIRHARRHHTMEK